MSNRLENKITVVTGGASGIGRSTSIGLAREGATVIICDLDVTGGQETLNQIKEIGKQAYFYSLDVSNGQQVEKIMDEIASIHGGIDIGFNNAGIPGTTNVLTADYDEDDWQRVISVNLKGVFLSMKYQLKHMLKQKGGTIVNTASIAGMGAFRGCPAYVATKHGIIGLTRAAGIEYANQGVRINAISPGFVKTPLLSLRDDEHEKNLAKRVPLGRIAEPEELAEAVIWLCSEESSYVAAHPLVVDGGILAQL
jgi:NAD(P)-dependent dehydrogenase (short-subunit alcohol dehydrogenase family)